MSIEKYNPRIEHETIPYAQINVNVVQNITNMEAGFVWVYLQTKPKDWKIIKEHLKKHFDIGDAKIKKIFSYLVKCHLIEYIKKCDDKGKILSWDIKVLNGSKFINYPQDKSTGSISHPVAAHSNGYGALHIIENTNNRKNREPAHKKRSPLSDDFAFKAPTLQRLEETAKRVGLPKDQLLAKFRNLAKTKRKTSHDWDAEFENFLINERGQPQRDVTQQKESRPIVKEFERDEPIKRASQETVKKHMQSINQLLKRKLVNDDKGRTRTV